MVQALILTHQNTGEFVEAFDSDETVDQRLREFATSFGETHSEIEFREGGWVTIAPNEVRITGDNGTVVLDVEEVTLQ